MRVVVLVAFVCLAVCAAAISPAHKPFPRFSAVAERRPCGRYGDYGTADASMKCNECVLGEGHSFWRGTYDCVWNTAVGGRCHSAKGERSAGKGFVKDKAGCEAKHPPGKFAPSSNLPWSLGFEWEFGSAQILQGAKSSVLSDPGIGQVVARSAAMVGPRNDITILESSVDLGRTLEVVTGPIPITDTVNVANNVDIAYSVFAARSLVRAVNTVAFADNCHSRPDAVAVKVKIGKTTKDTFAVPYDAVVNEFHNNLPTFLDHAYHHTLLKTKGILPVVFYIICGKHAFNMKRVDKPNTQINFGLKIDALGATDDRVVGLMSTHGEGITIYKNVQSKIDAFLNSQPQLSAQKASVSLRAVFQSFMVTAVVKTMGALYPALTAEGGGFAIKNVPGNMIKACVEDIIRTLPAAPKQALAAWTTANANAWPAMATTMATAFCGAAADCTGAAGVFNKLETVSGWMGKAKNPGAKAALETVLAANLKTFNFNTGRFPTDTANSYGTPVTDKVPDDAFAIKTDASYPPFQATHGANGAQGWYVVVEARIGKGSAFIQPLDLAVSAEDESLSIKEQLLRMQPGLALLTAANA